MLKCYLFSNTDFRICILDYLDAIGEKNLTPKNISLVAELFWECWATDVEVLAIYDSYDQLELVSSVEALENFIEREYF